MADGLTQLKNAYNTALNNLANAKATAASYTATAKEIGLVYDELKGRKDSMRQLRKDFNKFISIKYGDWKGDLWKSQYKAKGQDVVSAYDTVIGEIDTNLDRLNWERTRYENLASQQYGIIGSLVSTVNNIGTQIENWVN